MPGKATADALALQAREAAKDPADRIADRMAKEAEPATEEMIDAIEAMMAKASDLSEFRAMLGEAFGAIDARALAAVIEGGLVSAHAAGRSDVEDESE